MLKSVIVTVANYAYLDESGTKDNQHYMTVALVVFAGTRTAKKIHLQLLQALYPNKFKKGKIESHKMQLHYTDMDSLQRHLVGKQLSGIKVSVFASVYQHHNKKHHEEYFAIYRQLVHQVIEKALEEYKYLTVIIAKQGGWQKYQRYFLTDLKRIPEKHITAGRFVKAKFSLDSAINPGIQLADFYAGILREHILTTKIDSQSFNYELLTSQYKSIENYRAPK